MRYRLNDDVPGCSSPCVLTVYRVRDKWCVGRQTLDMDNFCDECLWLFDTLRLLASGCLEYCMPCVPPQKDNGHLSATPSQPEQPKSDQSPFCLYLFPSVKISDSGWTTGTIKSADKQFFPDIATPSQLQTMGLVLYNERGQENAAFGNL